LDSRAGRRRQRQLGEVSARKGRRRTRQRRGGRARHRGLGIGRCCGGWVRASPAGGDCRVRSQRSSSLDEKRVAGLRLPHRPPSARAAADRRFARTGIISPTVRERWRHARYRRALNHRRRGLRPQLPSTLLKCLSNQRGALLGPIPNPTVLEALKSLYACQGRVDAGLSFPRQ
jgi:hypothetical protein